MLKLGLSTITPHYDDAKTVYVLMEKDQWYCVTTYKEGWNYDLSDTIQQLKFRILLSSTLPYLKTSDEGDLWKMRQ